MFSHPLDRWEHWGKAVCPDPGLLECKFCVLKCGRVSPRGSLGPNIAPQKCVICPYCASQNFGCLRLKMRCFSLRNSNSQLLFKKLYGWAPWPAIPRGISRWELSPRDVWSLVQPPSVWDPWSQDPCPTHGGSGSKFQDRPKGSDRYKLYRHWRSRYGGVNWTWIWRQPAFIEHWLCTLCVSKLYIHSLIER